MLKKRILALLLVLAMAVSIYGCGTQEAPTEASTEPTTETPTETEPPAPNAFDLYFEAVQALNASDAVTMSVDAVQEHTVWGETFKQETESEIVLEGLQGELVAEQKGTLFFNDEIYFDFTEFYVDGHTYATFDSAKHREESTKEEYLARQYPICLFDAENFGEGTITEESYGTVLTFTEASALEGWVAPEYAELLSAEATALLSDDGIEEMSYTATYRQGASEVTLTVETELMLDCIPVLTAEAPEDADEYTLVSDVEAPRLLERAYFNLYASQDRSMDYLQTVTSTAAGVMLYYAITAEESAVSGDYVSKVSTDAALYSSDGAESYSYEDLYIDGIYTYTMDGETLSEDAMQADAMQDYLYNLYTDYILTGYFITTAEMTDMGDGYLIEFTSEDETFADYIKELTTAEIFDDTAVLDNASTAYETKELSGYIGIDKDTWLPTSYHLNFRGAHTISGFEYELSQELYCSYTAANPEAYENITEEALPEEEPTEKATPVFYHVTGGDGSEMWLLGTIHLGDERTAYLPQEIYDAFDASDALAVEFDMNAAFEQADEDEALQQQIMEMMLYTDGSTVEDHLDKEVYEAALQRLRYIGAYNSLNAEMMKVYLWENTISNGYAIGGRRLLSSKGMDQRLLDRAEAADKEILEVESLESQMEMLAGFSEELQEYMLKEILQYSRDEYVAEVSELYELWCSGDEAALIAYINEDTDLSEATEEELALKEEYDKAMSTDRNAEMIAVAEEYLSSGKTVFYAVGLAHLLAEDGLVEGLRAAGYTVELVSYAK